MAKNTIPDEIEVRGRRQFLKGAGGTLLAMPFLPSLMPREAKAQTVRPKYFVSLATSHGAVYQQHMFPGDSMLTESATYAGRTVKRGALTPTISGSQSALSTVLQAPTAKLTPRLLGKMNVIAGFDMPYALGHNTGGHLGNFAANDDDTYGKTKPIPSIDQVMAYSPAFYGNLSAVLRRSIHLGASHKERSLSYYWSNPATKTGTIQPNVGTADSLAVFDSIFVAPKTGTQPMRTPVIDRVLENYRRLRQGNRRLSASDRQRLDDHLTRLSEIQRRSKVLVSCPAVARPTKNASGIWEWPGPQGVANSIAGFQLLNDIIVAAFLCGTCRIATLDAATQQLAVFSDYIGDWHDLAHVASQKDPAAAATLAAEVSLREGYQKYFEHEFLDLITKLDVDDGTGHSILDDTLVVWTQEACAITHEGFSLPVIAAGGAGGALKTGSFIDYRDRARAMSITQGQTYAPGLVWNQWLGTALQAMGVPRAEYELPMYQPSRPAGAGTGGYGWFDDSTQMWSVQKVGDYKTAFPVMGEIPTFLKP
jgi:hypothetical protein